MRKKSSSSDVDDAKKRRKYLVTALEVNDSDSLLQITLHTNASNTQVLQGYISNRWIDILKQQFDLADKVTTTKSCSSDSDTKKRPLVKTDNNTPSVKSLVVYRSFVSRAILMMR